MRVLALMTDAFGGYGGIAQYNRDFVTALAGASFVRSKLDRNRGTNQCDGNSDPSHGFRTPQDQIHKVSHAVQVSLDQPLLLLERFQSHAENFPAQKVSQQFRGQYLHFRSKVIRNWQIKSDPA